MSPGKTTVGTCVSGFCMSTCYLDLLISERPLYLIFEAPGNFLGIGMRILKLSMLSVVLLLIAISVPADGYFATCTGDSPCHACKNCKYCKHCAKEGGTCGICRKR